MDKMVQNYIDEMKDKGERRADRMLFQWANKGYSGRLMVVLVALYVAAYYMGVWRGCCW